MDEEYFKISISKVIEMVLSEERHKIRKFYMDTLGKATSDMMDTYVPSKSEILDMFSR